MSEEAELSILARSKRRVAAELKRASSPAMIDRSEYGNAADLRVVERVSSVMAPTSS